MPATVSFVKQKIYFDAEITVHMEDRYNFNPGAADVATGILDETNDRFEIAGLAHYGTLKRHVRWEDGAPTTSHVANAPNGRQHQPSDNRRARNRL